MTIDKQALRQTAEKAQEHGVFNMDIHSETMLALLDENIQLQREKDAIEAVALALRDDMRQAREQLEASEERVTTAEYAMYEALNLAEERLDHINAIYDRERQEYDDCVKDKTRLASDLATANKRIEKNAKARIRRLNKKLNTE
ncbi:TPA: ead/Ea22-like family protein [Salmonella enterica subsp. diarizonae serovar 61:i:z]